MKITDIESYKKSINKLDSMAQGDPSKIVINFKTDESISEKMKRFFEVADGNSEWNA